MSRPSAPLPHPRSAVGAEASLYALTRVLEHAAHYAVQAPSVHNVQPWRIDIHPARMDIRADRSGQLIALDPKGRELVESVGAALFNVRVSVALDGWCSTIERCPRADDPDLLAEVRPVVGVPDPVLAALAPSVTRRRTNRRRFTGAHVPDAVLRRLTEIAETEGVLLIPVADEAHRRLVARLTERADGLQNADPAYRAELRHWTDRAPSDGDGVTTDVVPHVDGRLRDDVPLRVFATGGAGKLPPETHSDTDQTMVLLATRTDDELAWLRAGEALQHVFLELTRLGWVASPLPQAIEVPLTRTQLRAALTWNAHPQMLLRIGQATPAPRIPRRTLRDVVPASEAAAGPPIHETTEPTASSAHRPVPDGRGRPTWT
jgi:hypothetical protein